MNEDEKKNVKYIKKKKFDVVLARHLELSLREK